MFVWSKLVQNPSEVDVRTYARIKNVIWDQLLATKAEIIQNYKAVFSFCAQNAGGDFVNLSAMFVSVHFRREYSMCLKRYYIWHQPWNALMVINNIVFTLPEAMVEFSQEKINLSARQKPF